jgi:HEAT repeat protein
MTEPTQPKGLLKKLRLQEGDQTQPSQPDSAQRAWLLIGTLRTQDAQSQLTTVRTLIDIGAPAVPLLIEALGDKDEPIWRLASAALVKIGQPAVQPLVDALKHDNEQIRLLAAGTLHKMNALSPGNPGWNLMWQEYRKLLRFQREKKADSL